MTILDLLPGWFARRRADGIRDNDGNASVSANHIEPHAIARKRPEDVTRADVRAWIGELIVKPAAWRHPGEREPAPISRGTVKNALHLLSAFFRDMVDEGRLETNPCERAKVRNVARTTEPWTYLTHAEVRRARSAFARRAQTPAGLRTMIVFLLLIGAGLREGEARALRCGRVKLGTDGKVGSLHVREGRPGLPTKSKSGVRVVPLLPPFATDALALWSAATKLDFSADPDRYVFESSPGVPFSKGAICPRRIIRAALNEAGITRRVRVHDFRHTAATMWLSGVLKRKFSLEEIKQMLGHSSVSMTERYAHVQPELVLRAGDELLAAIAKAKATGLEMPPTMQASRGVEEVALG